MNAPTDETAIENKPLYVTEVPPEFRRVELFVIGTVPNKTLLPTDNILTATDNTTAPTPSETPFQTWQDAQQNNQNRPTLTPDTDIPRVEVVQNITVMVCPLTGMRATANCPDKHPETFKKGEEPKEFCTFHVGK